MHRWSEKLCVCVCACVCVRERGEKREKKEFYLMTDFKFLISLITKNNFPFVKLEMSFHGLSL